jgi:hypothetical protein
MTKSLTTLILLLTVTNCTSTVTQNKPVTPRAPMMCIALYLPVCGKDGKTYSNSCNANNAAVEFTQGECEAKK